MTAGRTFRRPPVRRSKARNAPNCGGILPAGGNTACRDVVYRNLAVVCGLHYKRRHFLAMMSNMGLDALVEWAQWQRSRGYSEATKKRRKGERMPRPGKSWFNRRGQLNTSLPYFPRRTTNQCDAVCGSIEGVSRSGEERHLLLPIHCCLLSALQHYQSRCYVGIEGCFCLTNCVHNRRNRPAASLSSLTSHITRLPQCRNLPERSLSLH